MTKFVARAVGQQAMKHAHRKGWFDVRLGFALLRDRRVRTSTKLLCLFLGFVATIVLEAFEMPLEAILAALIPFLGLGLDVAIEGVELVALPFVFGSVLLTHLADRNVVNAVREGR